MGIGKIKPIKSLRFKILTEPQFSKISFINRVTVHLFLTTPLFGRPLPDAARPSAGDRGAGRPTKALSPRSTSRGCGSVQRRSQALLEITERSAAPDLPRLRPPCGKASPPARTPGCRTSGGYKSHFARRQI